MNNEEFKKRFLERQSKLSADERTLDCDALVEHAPRFYELLCRAEFALEHATSIEQKQRALANVAIAVNGFSQAISPSGNGFQVSKLLTTSLISLASKNVVPELLRRRDVGRSDHGEAPFAPFLRASAVVCVHVLNVSGYNLTEARTFVANEFNRQPKLFAKFKQAHGRRGKKFTPSAIRDWWSNANYPSRSDSLEKSTLQTARAGFREGPTSHEDPEKYVRDMAEYLTNNRSFALQ